MVKNLIYLPMQETQFQSLSQEDPLEKGMAAHFSILAWRILMTKVLTLHEVRNNQILHYFQKCLWDFLKD